MGPCNAKIQISILALQVQQKKFRVQVWIFPTVYVTSTQ